MFLVFNIKQLICHLEPIVVGHPPRQSDKVSNVKGGKPVETWMLRLAGEEGREMSNTGKKYTVDS